MVVKGGVGDCARWYGEVVLVDIYYRMHYRVCYTLGAMLSLS